MTDKDSNLTESLASEIENAVDDLFGRYELGAEGGSKAAVEPKEPVAAQPAVPATPEPEPEPILDLTMDEPTAPPAATPPVRPAVDSGTGDIIAEMEEAILTVDWEVNATNTGKARSILKRLRDSLNLAATPGEEVASLMDRVLQCMEENPSAAPTSGPAHLRSGLEAIKACTANNAPPDREGRRLLVNAIQELQDSLPIAEKNGVLDLAAAEKSEFSLEIESAAEVKPEAPVTAADIAVPNGMERVLYEYSAGVDRALKRLIPMDDLFGRTPGMEKIHKLTSKVRVKLKKLQQENLESFNRDFTHAIGVVAANGDLSTFLNEHRSILEYCVNRLLPMESLFEKNSGYEKLHKLTKKIRIRLEREQGALERAMGGDYEPALAEVIEAAHEAKTAATYPAAETLPDPEVIAAVNECIRALDTVEDGDLVDTLAAVAKTKEILAGLQVRLGGGPAVATAPSKTVANHEICPWPILMKTVWGGRTVAFIPEQVAYQTPKKISSRKADKTSFFALKTLKASPWSSIRDMVSGELANEQQKVLKKMEIPVIRPPADYPGSTMKKQVMIILYQNGLGKACFLDAPVEPMDVPEEAQWQELIDTETGLAGTLVLDGEEIPVYSI